MARTDGLWIVAGIERDGRRYRATLAERHGGAVHMRSAEAYPTMRDAGAVANRMLAEAEAAAAVGAFLVAAAPRATAAEALSAARAAFIDGRVKALTRIGSDGRVRRTWLEALDELRDRGIVSEAEADAYEFRHELADDILTDEEIAECLRAHPSWRVWIEGTAYGAREADAIAEARAALETSDASAAERRAERRRLYGDTDADAIADRWRDALAEADALRAEADAIAARVEAERAEAERREARTCGDCGTVGNVCTDSDGARRCNPCSRAAADRRAAETAAEAERVAALAERVDGSPVFASFAPESREAIADGARAEAERLREEAREHERRAAESFERSDTDGFLSQWASGISAQEARLAADVAERGGVWTFPGLFDSASGVRVRARLVDVPAYGRFSGTVRKWVVLDSDGNAVHWVPAFKSGPRSRLASLGLEEREETAPGRAGTFAPKGARGLSGATSVYVAVRRTDGGFPADAVPWNELTRRRREHGA